jgi:putative aminopeptidase FrvX
VARRLLALPQNERGATVELVFNTDEEIGLRSAGKLEYVSPDIIAGYTFDGESFGQGL